MLALMASLTLLPTACMGLPNHSYGSVPSPSAMPSAPTTLWTSGHGFPCYRQPVVVSAGGTRLLAFVEGRFSSPCAPAAPLGAEAQQPSEVGGLNLRISEDGQHWGPSKIIYGNAVSSERVARAQ